MIVAIAGGGIAKVECKQCGKSHRYRPVGGTPAAARTTARSRSGKARGRAARALVEADSSRPPRTYRATDRYTVGDRIEHPRFGAGVVDRVAGPEKVQVFFPDGHRVLIHGRSERRS